MQPDLPLPPPAADAARVAAAAVAGSSQAGQGSKQEGRLEAVLLRHGALLAPASQPEAAAAAAAGGAAVAAQAAPHAADEDMEAQLQRLGRSYPHCRLLLWGEGEQGQEAAAGTLLKLMDGECGRCWGNPSLLCLLLLHRCACICPDFHALSHLCLPGCPMHCLSLPSLVVEGGDDAAAGCVALVSEALRRAGPSQPCLFYLPRLESWALTKVRD